MPTIYQIKNNSITTTIDQDETQVTSYRASTDEPITLIHDAHVQMLQDKFNEITGQSLDRSAFIEALGLADGRPVVEEPV